MSNEQQHLYEFGPFTLDTSARLLARAGAPVSLPPKSLDTLIVLVKSQGRLVEKDELMKSLWPDSFVEEANLNHHVWALRKALGRGPNGRRYIETVPRRGFRFVAEPDAEVVLEKHTFTRIITEEAEDVERPGAEGARADRRTERGSLSPPAARPRVSKSLVTAAVCFMLLAAGAALYRAWDGRDERRVEAAAATAGRPALRSIAVLPLKTIGAEDEDSAYLGLGVSDALITRLGNSRRLVVRPTSAVRRYADPLQDPLNAGREQRVEAVLDGSVQRAGDRIRVTVQLFRTRDGASLWSAKFDERFTDIFAVQDSISQQVVRELMVELEPEERRRLQRRGSENIEAYQAYLKGLYFWDKRTNEDYGKAVKHFGRAIELDPGYAQAYVGLGNAYAFLGGRDPVSQAEAKARQQAAVRKGLEFDETLAEAHAALGLIAMDSDWPEAEKAFTRAIELNPNYATAHQWYGEFLAWMGRLDEGIAELKLAHELDPLSLIISTDLGKVYTLSRRYDEAITQYKKVLALDPEFEVAQGLLALTYSFKGEHEDALRELRQIKDLESDPMYLSFLAYIHGEAGRTDEARQVLRRLSDLSKRSYVSPQWTAVAATGVGDNEQALKWLDRILKEGAQGKITFKVSPVWDELRPDPRFQALVRRANF